MPTLKVLGTAFAICGSEGRRHPAVVKIYARGREGTAPRFGQLNPLGRADEQFDAQFPLEVGNLPAQRRLRVPQLFRRSRELSKEARLLPRRRERRRSSMGDSV